MVIRILFSFNDGDLQTCFGNITGCTMHSLQ